MPRCPTCHRRLRGGGVCPTDGASAPTVTAAFPAAPPAIPGAQVLGPIGAGGFGSVWEARLESGAHAAIKVAHAATELAAERFRREAEALATVGSPWVPELHASGRLADGRPYLVMERLEGATLAAEIERAPTPLTAERARTLVDPLLRSLEAVHDAGLVHRDLKPENVFFAGEHARLVDFGLARANESASLTRTGMVVGTPEYMSPEQLRGDPDVDPRSDLYAVGVILYELVTLRLPFAGDAATVEQGHLLLRPPPPSGHAPLPPALEDLILACLAKDPALRPSSAHELRARLARIETTESRAPARASGSPSLLMERRHPTVLMVVEAPATEPIELQAILREHRGFVVRQRGGVIVCAFLGLDADDPVEAAIAAASRLATGDARAAIHLVSLTVRRREAAVPTVYGPAVERPETWLPRGPWRGIVLTPEATSVLPAGAVHAAEIPGFFTPAPRAPLARVGPPFVGREAVLDAILAELARRRDGGGCGLIAVLGEPGLGKSRVLSEVAERARASHPDWRILTARGAPGSENADALARSLAAGPDGPVLLLVDDAHEADPALLDAIERATQASERSTRLVVAAADPRLLRGRPGFGARTPHFSRLDLPPLEEAAAMTLAEELLRPAEHVPADVLRQIARWAGGIPAFLVQIVDALKRDGFVRQRPGLEGWTVATAAIERLPSSPVSQWLASRTLDGLPPELAAFARVLCVLGETFGDDEVRSVEDAVARSGGAGSPVDAGAGLRELVRRGLLVETGPGRHAFRSATFQDGVQRLLSNEDRAAIHRHALTYWRSVEGAGEPRREVLEAVARHAAGAGDSALAAAAYLRLGDLNRREHRHVEADETYTAALSHLPEADGLGRARALLGRGRVRYRSQRLGEARADLQAAQALADAAGDARLAVEALLEEATVLDWLQDWAASSAAAERAQERLADLDDPVLATRGRLALGRSHFRFERARQANELLAQVVEEARRHGDTETLVIALLVLGLSLSYEDRWGEMGSVFEQVIDLCQAEGDRLHLAVAHQNRIFLWLKLGRPEEATRDLDRSVALARELGHVKIEYSGLFMLALLRYWMGQLEEAIALAETARRLYARVEKDPGREHELLYVRFAAAAGRHEEARGLLAAMERAGAREALAESERLLFDVVRLFLAELEAPVGDDAWRELLSGASRKASIEDELFEAYWFAIAAARACGRVAGQTRLVEEARRLAAGSPAWLERFAGLG